MRPHQAAGLHRVTLDQCGVVRREQVYALGVSPRTVQRHIAEGRWMPQGRKVLVLPGTADTLFTRSLITAHQVHPDGQLTGWSALAVAGLLETRPWNRVRPQPQPWIRVAQHHRVSARTIRLSVLPRGQALHGVSIASRDEVIADLLRYLPADDASTLAYQLSQSLGAATLTSLLAEAIQAVPNGKGIRQLHRLIDALATGSQSDAERLLVRLLVEAGATGFQVNLPVRAQGRLFRIDVAFPEQRVAIEVDGRAFHSSAEQFQGDRTRQNLLIAAGWRVLRFTWEDLTRRPERVLAQIAELVNR